LWTLAENPAKMAVALGLDHWILSLIVFRATFFS